GSHEVGADGQPTGNELGPVPPRVLCGRFQGHACDRPTNCGRNGISLGHGSPPVVWVRAGGRYQLPSARRLRYYQNVLVLPKYGKIVNRKGNTKKATWSACDRARSGPYDTASDGT